MAEFELPVPFPPDFIQGIPDQRTFINEKMLEGVIKSYTLSLDRQKLWIVLHVDNEWDVYNLVAEMPLAKWLSPEVSPLMFHNTAEVMMPFSLN